MARRMRIGVLTSGGDAPGMNAAIRAVVRTALEEQFKVFGFYGGFEGLVHSNFKELDYEDVGGILQRGGTVLYTSRFPQFREEAVRRQALDVLEDLQLDGLVVIGGEGSMKGALALSRMGVPVVGIPASIDNDVWGTDDTIGADTALNTIVRAIDRIKDTASSHHRAFVVEVMGNRSGYLALVAAIASGAEAAVIPEAPVDFQALARELNRRAREGRTNSIVVVSEAAATAQEVMEKLRENGVDYELRATVLGHLQRGGSPTFYDRIIASHFGMQAVFALRDGQAGVMIGEQHLSYVQVPLDEVTSRRKTIPQEYLALAHTLMWEA